MTHRRDFKTIFEVSEWITDSRLFREYDVAVFMINYEKMKKIERFTLTRLSSDSKPLDRALVVLIFSGILTNY